MLCNIQIVQLQELFEVRHSVFIVGNAGTGKSCVWKSLLRANQNLKKKPVAIDLNPKAVTNDELFGIINPSTREWKDGKLTMKTIKVDDTCHVIWVIYLLLYMFMHAHTNTHMFVCVCVCVSVYMLSTVIWYTLVQ